MIIEHPNRKKASSKLTRAVVVVLLLVSAGLVAIITVGGWDALEGAKALQVIYIVLYVVLAFFVLRSQARIALKLDDADAALAAAHAAKASSPPA